MNVMNVCIWHCTLIFTTGWKTQSRTFCTGTSLVQLLNSKGKQLQYINTWWRAVFPPFSISNLSKWYEDYTFFFFISFFTDDKPPTSLCFIHLNLKKFAASLSKPCAFEQFWHVSVVPLSLTRNRAPTGWRHQTTAWWWYPGRAS